MTGNSDVNVAQAAAQAAAAVLVRIRGIGGLTGSALGDAGDAAAERVISEVLAARRPADAVFSEEADDDESRLQASRVWIIDPLDGTREYGEGDRLDWAVHVALWVEGELTAAAVALPALGKILLTDPAPVLPPRPEGPPRLTLSRSRPPRAATVVADALGTTLVPLGSAGYKIAALVRGEADIYVHAGGQYQWDSAAPVAIARAAGLFTSRLDGSALTYNDPDPWLPDLLVTRPELADRVLEVLRELDE